MFKRLILLTENIVRRRRRKAEISARQK